MVKEGNNVWVSLEMFIVSDWRSPCMVKSNDIWISVLVLVVWLLTFLGSELIQAGSSSEKRKNCQKSFFAKKKFLGWVGWGVLCHCAWGGGSDERKI